MSSDDEDIIKDRSIKLINLNNKRKKIEQNILNEINFEKIRNEKKDIVIYYRKNLNEGLIGIIASKLKDHFNKPSIVITNSNNILKASARSTSSYNISHSIKSLIDKNIIENGGGHNMAAGFTIKKNNIRLLNDFIQKDYFIKNSHLNNSSKYDGEISASAINLEFMKELNKLKPFGNFNHSPFFLIKDLKIIKTHIINHKHISAIIKPDIGSSIKTICFNCSNNDIGKYLLSYKKKINIIAQIHENEWNNKKTIQLNIMDLIL